MQIDETRGQGPIGIAEETAHYPMLPVVMNLEIKSPALLGHGLPYVHLLWYLGRRCCRLAEMAE